MFKEVPTLFPTLSQLNNFEDYLEEITKIYKPLFGAIIIQPPKNWVKPIISLEKKSQTLIKNPIEQQISLKIHGVYECSLIPKQSIKFS